MSRKVLVVDDEDGILRLVQRALAADPIVVVPATSASEAIELLATDPDIELVISDEMMPGMRGTELLAFVRDAYPDTVRILMTGHADIDTAIAAINRGEIFHFLCKPFELPAFTRLVHQALVLQAHRVQGKRLLRLLDASSASFEGWDPGEM